jgi:hypothetical protein
MKFRNCIFLFLTFLIVPGSVRAQELPELLRKVLQTDTSYHSISCKIAIEVDVPGLNIPEKSVELNLEKGKEPKIKSKGLIILPKRGIIGQYSEFLDLACQAIPMSENGDTILYKVVSLDKKTDWVTVDVSVTQSDAKVHSMLISTRKAGEYLVRHFYGAEQTVFPEKTVISFEAMPLKLPLKFMGQQDNMDPQLDQDGPVTGKVILRYSDITLR